jgi:hypothetical protein
MMDSHELAVAAVEAYNQMIGAATSDVMEETEET